MGTRIKVWQIVDNKLEPIETTLEKEGKKEDDLRNWIKEKPEILGEDILIIGEKVDTKKAGEIDLLGIDKEGNLVIIEVKRNKPPREVLAQTIDYASAVADWDFDRINEICQNFHKGKDLRELLKTYFDLEDEELENLTINESQRILIVGVSSIEESLERMVKWLSERYEVDINVVILNYIKTQKGEELIATTQIIPEEIEKERREKRQKTLPRMSLEEIQKMAKEIGEEDKFQKLLEGLREIFDIISTTSTGYVIFQAYIGGRGPLVICKICPKTKSTPTREKKLYFECFIDNFCKYFNITEDKAKEILPKNIKRSGEGKLNQYYGFFEELEDIDNFLKKLKELKDKKEGEEYGM